MCDKIKHVAESKQINKLKTCKKDFKKMLTKKAINDNIKKSLESDRVKMIFEN